MEILPEVEVWYALPAIRRKLAQTMKERGVPQKQIAEVLKIAPSAVSQYVSGKRGSSVLPKELDSEFEEAVERIMNGSEDDMIREIMKLSEKLKDTRVICDIHRQNADDVPSNCSCCFE